jgi:hypothetical protein
MSSTARRHAALSSDGSDLPARQVYFDHERPGVHAQKARLAERAYIGRNWDGKPANDNINWPLAKALLTEGNGELLKYAMAYRRIYDHAKSEAELGMGDSTGPEMVVVHRSRIDESSGTLIYGGELVHKAGTIEIPATRTSPTNPDSKKSATPVTKPWNGDAPVNNMIDAKRELARLNARMGPTVEPFEMACIDGATLAEVGNALGVANRAGSMGAGKALCHLALITIRDNLRKPERLDLVA